jgi:MoaA/NifB/PqqE/SkfB family radical SAM enzyme
MLPAVSAALFLLRDESVAVSESQQVRCMGLLSGLTKAPDGGRVDAWLDGKGLHDYWYRTAVPDDVVTRQQAVWRRQLAAGQLNCRVVTWSVTNRCSLRCQHCGVFGGEQQYEDLTLHEFASAIPDMLDLGVRQVVLTGGEPLLRPDLPQLLQLLRLSGFEIGMVTGGFRGEARLRPLPDGMVDALTVSIDGLADTHDRLRGRSGSWEDALATVRLARQKGVRVVAVATCVQTHTLDELPALRAQLDEAGANFWLLRPVAPIGRAAEANLGLDDTGIKRLLAFARESLRSGFDVSVADLGYMGPWDSILRLGPYLPTYGWDHMAIMPNGDIKGLGESHLPVEGNLRVDRLMDVWQKRFGYYREPELPQDCLDCEYFGRCGGGFVPVGPGGIRCVKHLFDSADV